MECRRYAFPAQRNAGAQLCAPVAGWAWSVSGVVETTDVVIEVVRQQRVRKDVGRWCCAVR